MNKLATAFGCLMMLGVAFAPTAFAHGDTGNHVGLAPAGWRTAQGAGATTPAGFYSGSASAWLTAGAGSVPNCPNPTGDATVDALLCSLPATFTTAAAFGLCDLEVLGDGTAPFPEDESNVDGPNHGVGLLPDGLFNDGGAGAVCHTPASYYGFAPYNTPGCTAGTATAEDLVVGGNIWVSATCDSIRPVASTPLLTRVLSLETCTVNSVLSGTDPFASGGAVECVQRFVDCSPVGAAGACPATGATACVPDGVADASNSGYGGPNSGPLNGFYTAAVTRNPATPVGVPYPGIDASCVGLGSDSSQAAFVWNSVQADSTGLTVVSVATHGWVK